MELEAAARLGAADVQRLQESLESARQEIESLRQSPPDDGANVAQLQAALADAQTKLAVAQAELSVARGEAARLKTERDRLIADGVSTGEERVSTGDDEGQADSPLKALVTENRNQSETITGLENQVTALQRLREGSDRSRSESENRLERMTTENATLNSRVEVMQQEKTARDAELRRLRAMDNADADVQEITPEEASVLFQKTFDSLQSLGRLRVQDADITVRMAAGKVGDETVMLLPKPGRTIDPGSVHELRLRLQDVGEDVRRSAARETPTK